MSHPTTPSFAQRVITWQRHHGRHDLPWQNTRDAYRIWLSEIMLQQTQVSAVVPYYTRFLERFPTVHALATAPVDEVMAAWSGLGYYSRARNLHACGQRVVNEFGGAFPRDPGVLQSLPGIGRSTAAAITAFAYGTRAAILDGNVKRVFARHWGVEGWPGTPAVERGLWTIAERELPEQTVEPYTQGLMDLGATVCVRSRPACGACPVADTCVARRENRTAELPAAKPRKASPTRDAHMLVALHANEVLLEKRPPLGIWGGLWSLPQFDDEASLQAAVRRIDASARLAALPARTHAFSHYTLRYVPHVATCDRASVTAAEPGAVWLPFTDVAQAALPAPVKKLLLELAEPRLL
ncbi:MAG TPA: A/G-specific adenine glycosylase [Burkholderiaceae bacterium]|nr:A/G-specific adenine glycosylase [Burkholderiaceae bacterium]